MQKAFAVLFCLTAGIACGANIITVDDDGPADYTTIGVAIDAAIDGDIVVVCPGTYTGEDNRNINLASKAITVRSTDPQDPAVVAATIIDCDYLGRGFDFNNSEGPDSIVNGFTIVNAEDTDLDYEGGAIRCDGSSPTIANCRILNSLGYIGGGICNENGSSPTLINCVISGNDGGDSGGGLFNSNNSDPNVINCAFSGNSAWEGGAIFNDQSNPNVTNCTITGNLANNGGGIFNEYDCISKVTNCSFSDNLATAIGGSIFNNGNSNAILNNCILWGNGPNEIYIETGTVTVDYSNVQGGYSGTGNINEDPLFVDADGPDDVVGTEDDNLRLLSSSPCIDAGDSTAVGVDRSDLDDDGSKTEQTPWDLDGNLRFLDDPNTTDTGVTDGPVPVVDMGAYESSGLTMVGDFEPDGDVDLDDLGVILGWWLEVDCGECGGGDLSGDGNINLADFAKFAKTGLVGGGGQSHKPILAPIGNKSILEEQNLNFTVSATDPDEDSLTYLALNLPSGAVFDPPSQVFDWTPAIGQTGQYFVTILVFDGIEVDSETVAITVSPEPVTVPDVVDTAQASAEAAITTAGLVVGSVTTSYDPVIAAGNVISQDPVAGSSVLPGTSVDLVVSLGPEPVGHWTMDDDATNTTVEDSSSNENHGTAQQNTEDISTAGIIDGALDFNGTSDYVDCGDGAGLDFGTGDFSICMWMKTSSSLAMRLVNKRDASNIGYEITTNTSGQIRAGIGDSSGYTQGVGGTVNDNAWHHVAITYDRDGSVSLYVDAGTPSTADISIRSGSIDNSESFRIGRLRLPDKYFDGTIDDLRIFNHVLSADEIVDLYNEPAN